MSPLPPQFPLFRWVGILVWIAGVALHGQSPVPNTLRHSFFAPKTLPQEFERQGSSVAIAGDTAVVGSPHFDSDPEVGDDTGAVKVYRVSTGEFLYLLKNPDPTPFSYFGQTVAISGSIIAVGSGAPVAGAAYAGRVDVYDLSSPSPMVPFLTLDNPSPGERDQFGNSLAIDGNRLVVGAWLDDNGAADSGVAYVYDLGSSTPQVPKHVLANPSPAEKDCFGSAVAVAGNRVVVSAYLGDTGALNSGRAYVFDLGSTTPGVPSMMLARPVGAINDGFGSSLALSGSKVVVGIETADESLSNSGSAMVFDLSSPVPTVPIVTLVNPAPSAGGYFGTSVSISGNTVAVGAYRDKTVAGYGGACHIYDLAGSTPAVAVLTLKKPLPQFGDLFGNAVSVSGSKILVGASHDGTGEVDAGSAYLFDVSSGSPLVPASTFSNPVKNSADRFGAAVAIHGDRVAVGSPDSHAGSSSAGRVAIHDLASAQPGQMVTNLENPDPSAGDQFGSAVAISGDRLAVGATGEDSGALDAGKVYVYDLAAGDPGLAFVAIPNPHPATSDRFGSAVGISDEYLIVGTGDDDQNAADSGRAYLFNLAGPSPTVPSVILENPSPAPGDRFGSSVSISGNLLVVGAPGDDTVATDAGRAYVFDLMGNLLHTLAMPSPAAGDVFGSAVAIASGRVVVGAPGSDAGASNTGAALVFLVTGSTPTSPEAVLANPTVSPGDQFGLAVAASGTRVVVGAMLADGPADSGRVYSFNMVSATPTIPSASLAKSVPFSGDLFGSSVGVYGTIIVVGTPSDNKTNADKGAAYVFGPAAPEIAVKDFQGIDIHSGGASSFGPVAMGPGGGGSLAFSILNTGITGLSISQVSVTDGNAADFTVSTTGMLATVPPGDDTGFIVAFNPSAPGHRSTVLRISNSDSDENPFEILLSGHSLSPDHDTDGDGLNDVAELRMAELGFDWQVPNPSLVATFNATANQAGLSRPDQVRSLRVPPPTLSRGPGPGQMTLTMWLEQSAVPSGYQPFPLVPADTTFTPAGEMEFLFSVSDDTCYFRLETK